MSKEFNLLPYPSHIGSPVIRVEDTSHFKQKQVTKFNNFVDKRFTELKTEIEKLKELYELNEFIYTLDLRFEPIIGDVYHVYQGKDSKNFLSMIAPHQCNFTYICSVSLNTDGQWVLQKGTFPRNQS